MHIIEENWFRCANPQTEDLQILWGRSDLKILNWSKSLGIYSCQPWVFKGLVEIENLFPENLVAKHNLNALENPLDLKSSDLKDRVSNLANSPRTVKDC